MQLVQFDGIQKPAITLDCVSSRPNFVGASGNIGAARSEGKYQLVIAQSGHSGLIHIQSACRCHLREFLTLNYLVDRNGDSNLCLFLFRVANTKIGEDIAGTWNHLRLSSSLLHIKAEPTATSAVNPESERMRPEQRITRR